MDYYIQGGGVAKAAKIKAAFEKLGYDVKNWRFTTGVYYSLNGRIVNTSIGSNEYKLILNNPDYKELELPIESKFKVGDWVVGIDDEGDMATEKIVSFSHNKVLLVDTDGCHTEYPKTELSNFHLWKIADAKDGDVLVSGIDNPFIYDGNIEFSSAGAYVGVSRDGRIRLDFFPSKAWTSIKDMKPATKEQRDLLFAKLRELGYEWDADKKELRRIQPHYDIANFHAGMPVLVRDDRQKKWCYALYSHHDNEDSYQFVTAGDNPYIQCIPFDEKTKHLLGTTDMCDEQYINW